jgi:hypothetical protein
MRGAPNPKPPNTRRRSGPIALAVIATAVAVAACGSSSKPRSAAGSTGAGFGVKYADCMRAHGVPNFPDPSAGGGGVQIQTGSGINPFSPSFKAAQESCAKLLPGGGPGRQHPSAQLIKQMLQTSECMRRHGVSGFPDPTRYPPSSPAGYSILEDRGGVILAIPNTINVASPTFKQSATVCSFK